MNDKAFVTITLAAAKLKAWAKLLNATKPLIAVDMLKRNEIALEQEQTMTIPRGTARELQPRRSWYIEIQLTSGSINLRVEVLGECLGTSHTDLSSVGDDEYIQLMLACY